MKVCPIFMSPLSSNDSWVKCNFWSILVCLRSVTWLEKLVWSTFVSIYRKKYAGVFFGPEKYLKEFIFTWWLRKFDFGPHIFFSKFMITCYFESKLEQIRTIENWIKIGLGHVIINFEWKIEWTKIRFPEQAHHVRMNSFKHFSGPKKGPRVIETGSNSFLYKGSMMASIYTSLSPGRFLTCVFIKAIWSRVQGKKTWWWKWKFSDPFSWGGFWLRN